MTSAPFEPVAQTETPPASLAARAFAVLGDALVVVDDRWAVLVVNGAAQRLIELAGAGAVTVGADLRRWIGAADGLLSQAQADGLWRGERALGATSLPVEIKVTALPAAPGQPAAFVVALHDLRERRALEERLQRDARMDPLTQLPNRLGMQWHAELALAAALPQFGLVRVDLDSFKELSDSYGHEQGERLLAAVGARLQDRFGVDHVLARWGIDEFVLLLEGGPDVTVTARVAQRIIDSHSSGMSSA